MLIWAAFTLHLYASAFDNTEWFACKSDADCVLKPYLCGVPKAVNKKYAKDLTDHVQKLDAACPNQSLKIEADRAFCLKGSCQVLFKDSVSK